MGKGEGVGEGRKGGGIRIQMTAEKGIGEIGEERRKGRAVVERGRGYSDGMDKKGVEEKEKEKETDGRRRKE